MLLPVAVGILFAELWALSVILLVAHRLSPRLGLTPLLFVLGVSVGVLQFPPEQYLKIEWAGRTTALATSSFVFLPAILLGLLIIYVINGTTQARTVLLSIVGVTLLAAVFRFFPPLRPSEGEAALTVSGAGPNLRILIASAIALIADMYVLVLSYQWLSNLRRRYPSRLAGVLALMAGLWCDGLLFASAAYAGLADFWSKLAFNLAGKTLSGVALAPFIIIYFHRFVRSFPDSAATVSRPVGDIFTRSLKWEEQARYDQNLLDTLLQINHLVTRTTDLQTLLEGTCRLLVINRNYLLVWINIPSKQKAFFAGLQNAYLREALIGAERKVPADALWENVCCGGRPVIIADIARHKENPPWKKVALQNGGRSLGIFPLYQGETLLGMLGVMAAFPNAFDAEEIRLLQELADDLANALTDLETRQQQAILFTAAETMLDGLIVTDLEGNLLYANPAVQNRLPPPRQDLKNLNIRQFFAADNGKKVFETYRQALLEQGTLTAEFDFKDVDGQQTYIAVRAAPVYDSNHQPVQIVISIRDITRRRQYEHQMMTLNQLITELVQIRDLKVLLKNLLVASTELMQAWAAAIFLTIPGSQAVEETLHYNISDEYIQRIKQDYRGLPGEQAWKTLQPVAVADVLNDPVFESRIHFMAEYGVRALLILPLIYQEQPLGALTIYHNQPHVFMEDELQLGLTLAHTLSIAIQNARLYQSEHNQRQLAEALARAAASLNRLLDPDEVLDTILEQVLRVTGCQSANILLVEGDHARLARAMGYEAIPNHFRAGGEKGIQLSIPTFQHMISTRQPLLIPDTRQDKRWTQIEGTEWIRSHAGVPLQVGEHVVGFLCVDSELPGFVTAEMTHRLQALADYAATAIHNARLYSQLQTYANVLEDRVRQRTAELKAAKERIEGILTSVPEAVFVLDEKNRPVHANQAGEALMLLALQKEIDLFSPNFLAQLRDSNLPAERAVLEFGGHAYQALISPLTAQETQGGLVIVFRDVTRFRELDQMKTRFVSDVSHELRTPLTNLMLYLDLLSALDDLNRGSHYLQTLKRETQRLSHLIEDLLTISRLEAGRVEIASRPTEINRLLTDLVSDRQMLAQSRELTLRFEPSANLPMAMADPNLLNQAVSNLLTNAIHYTPSGGSITISTALEQDEQATWVTVRVADTGVGIPAEELPHVFERFYRGAASRQTGSPGTGLGLAIAREIITRLNGHISVESKPGVGSTFTLWLRAVL